MFLYSNSFTATCPLLIATRNLQAGSLLTTADMQIARVQVEDDIFAAAVLGDALSDILGPRLPELVYAKRILVRAQVSELLRAPLTSSCARPSRCGW